ncbi:GIDE domain-containing protein [Solimonas variicoloris]|uniref:GIDE domain-containing protein n=1 Tax=Solimonas variicoloris TaxID=254408 RepID=UPI00037D7668|nr:GIDE domain-containing protein [Solimonas variicoloris]
MPLLELGRELAATPPAPFWLMCTLLALLSAGAFLSGFRRLRRARHLEDTPTSRIRSAAQGYVELRGYARLLPGPDIVSPLSGVRCAWWRYRIEYRRTEDDSSGHSSDWEVIEQASSEELFLLADDSGECIVDPHRARAWPSLSRRWQGDSRRPARIPARTPWLTSGNYRYSEQLIGIGDPLYVHGWFRTQSAAQQYDEAAEVRDLLRVWKTDRHELLRRFDANGDGEVDFAEWEQARRAAQQQVRAEHLEQSLHPELHVLAVPPDGRDFILSTLDEHVLARRLRAQGLALLALGLAAGGALSGLLGLRGA